MYPADLFDVSYEEVKARLLSHVQPANYEIAERAKFNSLVREANESLKMFVLRLQQQAARCNFADYLETALRDRLIAGINNANMQRKMLLAPNPTFQSVRALAEQSEEVTNLVEANSQVLYQKFGRSKDVDRFQKKHSSFNSNRAPRFDKDLADDKPARSTRCDSCGQSHRRPNCSFQNAVCYKCGKIGHIQKVCRSRESTKTLTNTFETDSLKEYDSLTLTTHTNGYILENLIAASGESQTFILDTGSIESLIPIGRLKFFYPNAQMRQTQSKINGVTGHQLNLHGETMIPIERGSGQIDCKFLVSDSGPSILGIRNMKKLRISISLHDKCSTTSPTTCYSIQPFIPTNGFKTKGKLQHQKVNDAGLTKSQEPPCGFHGSVQNEVSNIVQEGQSLSCIKIELVSLYQN